MTLAASAQKVTYACDGGTVLFNVPFIFWEDATLYVYIFDTVLNARTDLVLSTDYTVAGGDGSTGSITTVATYSSAYTITIVRSVPLTQGAALPLSGAFPSSSVEETLDRIVAITQDIQEQVDRSIKLPADSTVDPDSVSLSAATLVAYVTQPTATTELEINWDPALEFSHYILELSNVEGTSATSALVMQMRITTLGAWETSGYVSCGTGIDVVGGAFSWNASSQSYITLLPALSGTKMVTSARLLLHSANSSNKWQGIGGSIYAAGSNVASAVVAGNKYNLNSIAGLKVYSASTTILGTLRLWGLPTA